jgi:S-adenosyl methyltransferase
VVDVSLGRLVTAAAAHNQQQVRHPVADDSFSPSELPPELNSNVPQTARIWNYWLGGKDNFPVDRQVGDQILEAFPAIVENARASRAFLVRAVRYLAGEAGIRQFLDIGTGLPTADNTHQIAQAVAPESRVVYVDNDPQVLAHARALLTSSPEGATAYLDADLRDPDTILREAARTLDFTRPVAIMLMGILGHIADDDEARSIVRRLLEALPSGSYLALCDGTDTNPAGVAAQARYNESGAIPYRLRSPEQIAGFFEGLELVEPGVVSLPRWRPDPADAGGPAEVDAFGGVGRKP